MSFSVSSLIFLSLVLVSGRRATLDSESTKEKSAVTISTVSAACAADGAFKLRMTCFSRSLGWMGLVGRSRGWSVIWPPVGSEREREAEMATHRKRAEVRHNFGILQKFGQGKGLQHAIGHVSEFYPSVRFGSILCVEIPTRHDGEFRGDARVFCRFCKSLQDKLRMARSV